MGSFNIKCFASGQVIAENEKCRVAVILQAASYAPAQLIFREKEYLLHGINNSYSGPYSFWTPLTGFMSGTYDDCGMVALDATAENLAMLASFYSELSRCTARTLPGESGSSRDSPFDINALAQAVAPKLFEALQKLKGWYEYLAPGELDINEALALWDALQHAVRDNRVFYVNGNQVLRPLKLAVVHDVTFQRLVAAAEGVKTFSGRSYAREAYFTAAFEQLTQELVDVEDESRRFIGRDNFREYLRMHTPSSLMRPVQWAFRRTFDAAVSAVMDDGQPVSAFLAACKEPLDGLYALKGLDELDIQFSPIAYAGQDNDNVTGKQYADFVAGASQEICAARKARYGEYE